MIIRIEIDCDDDALEDDGSIDEVELHRILCTVPPKVNNQLDAPEALYKLLDINGNTVGTLKVIRRRT